MTRDCKHGHLARSCDLCELDDLRAEPRGCWLRLSSTGWPKGSHDQLLGR